MKENYKITTVRKKNDDPNLKKKIMWDKSYVRKKVKITTHYLVLAQTLLITPKILFYKLNVVIQIWEEVEGYVKGIFVKEVKSLSVIAMCQGIRSKFLKHEEEFKHVI